MIKFTVRTDLPISKVFGGEVSMGYTREIETLEITNNGIRSAQVEDMPNLLVDASAVSYNDQVYVFGGFDFGPKSFQGRRGLESRHNKSYFQGLDSWFSTGTENGTLTTKRRKHTSTAIGTKVLVTGDYDSR